MEEIIIALLGNAAFRLLVEETAVKIVGEIIHRRSVDPDFLKRSDEAFAASMAAKTEEDRFNASKQLQSLISA